MAETPNFGQRTIGMLKAELKKRGARLTGNKETLVKRLGKDIDAIKI